MLPSAVFGSLPNTLHVFTGLLGTWLSLKPLLSELTAFVRFRAWWGRHACRQAPTCTSWRLLQEPREQSQTGIQWLDMKTWWRKELTVEVILGRGGIRRLLRELKSPCFGSCDTDWKKTKIQYHLLDLLKAGADVQAGVVLIVK